ncbi:hypothetical protein [Microbacterium sp.]|uniref:hypothetical protein n=1 Tax=Microbacterium sp. TaxID=51671 RepID=UPI00260BB858|nr:hypothetical protein [Microbacterium sp.]
MTSSETLSATWALVRERVGQAVAMHFDGCHKIYLSMDDGQVAVFEDCGYDTHAPDFDRLRAWYAESCDLRLVTAVSTNADGTDDFESLIDQFADPDADS